MSTPFGGLNIAETAVSVRDWVIQKFADANNPLPARRYVAPGDPRGVAWDCEQFVVAMAGVGWGHATDEAEPSAKTGTQVSVVGLRHVVLELQVVRCTPQPEGRDRLPTPAAIDLAGVQFFRDAGVLSQAMLTWAAQAQPNVSGLGGLVQCGAIEPIGPDGGFHGIAGTITVTVGALT